MSDAPATVAPGFWAAGAGMHEDAQAKLGLESLLDPFVTTQTQREVQPTAQFVDVYVSGTPTAPDEMVRTLGLLGRIASEPCLLEVFSDTVTLSEARSCLRKQLNLHHTLELESKAKVVFPWLWLVSQGRPEAVRRAWTLKRPRGWPRGVYRSTEGLAAGVVVLRELPARLDTATLRLFGDQGIRAKLLQELIGLPDTTPTLQAVRKVLYRWRIWTRGHPEDEAMRRRVMDFEKLVEEETKKLMDLGRLEGRLEGQALGERRSLMRVMARRKLALTAAQQAQIHACTDLETLERWLDQAVTAATADEALR